MGGSAENHVVTGFLRTTAELQLFVIGAAALGELELAQEKGPPLGRA